MFLAGHLSGFSFYGSFTIRDGPLTLNQCGRLALLMVMLYDGRIDYLGRPVYDDVSLLLKAERRRYH